MSLSDTVSGAKRKLAAAKPYIGGAIVGAIVTVIVEFNAGWVVTADTHVQEVAKARINAVASVCAQQAREHWTTGGHEMAALDGWTNKKRDQLAERFTPTLEKVRESSVTDLCDEMLDPT